MCPAYRFPTFAPWGSYTPIPLYGHEYGGTGTARDPKGEALVRRSERGGVESRRADREAIGCATASSKMDKGTPTSPEKHSHPEPI